MTTKIDGIEGLRQLVGEHAGYSDWHEVTQEQVQRFADATGDHQWIHVDVERARAESPYHSTIAHGFLTLSVIPALSKANYRVENAKMGINYGLNKLRFPSPVPVGSKLRAGASITSVEDVSGGVQVLLTVTYEVEGAAKPACVAEILFRYYS